MKTNRRGSLAALAAAAVVVTSATIFAQGPAPSPEDKKLQELWKDFVHYIRIARPQLAQSFGQALLESGAEARDIYRLAAQTPGSTAILGRATRLAGMKEIVDKLRKVIEQGYEDLRSDPQEIAAAIEMLGGTIRGFEIAARRLATSGEYAMPQLIQKLTDPQTPGRLRENIIVALPRLGKAAVRPLSVALQTSDPKLQEVLANALGQIEYPHAAPRLKELSVREGILPRVKRAAELALIACAGESALKKSVAALYYDHALNYYYRRESVSPDVRYKTANVWYWTEGLGLNYKPVPREIFCDIYAMRMSRLALRHDGEFYPAVSLWIAANLNRAARLPDGASDPTYGENTPSAKFFALASSARYLQDVLGRALRDGNSAVAIGAIKALAETAGAKNLVSPVSGGSQPLVAALGYGDRHVRFLAAVSLANALPDKRFAGYELVVPQLVEALRQTGKKTALLIVEDQDQRNIIKDALRGAGWRLIDKSAIGEAIAAAHASAGVDVAVLGTRPDARAAVMRFRQDPALVMLPVVAVGRSQSLRDLAQADGRVVLVDKPVAVAAALDQAAKLAAGKEMLPKDAAAWVVRAAEAIRNLGLTGNTVFNIARAEGSLVAALDDEREAVRLAASRALAVMQSASAQRAIASRAVDARTPERVRVAAFKDLAASLRRYGNLLSEELSQAVVEVVGGQGSGELLTAAAQSLGAMNLPSEKIKSLIARTAN